jgi:hypothetical protein
MPNLNLKNITIKKLEDKNFSTYLFNLLGAVIPLRPNFKIAWSITKVKTLK